MRQPDQSKETARRRHLDAIDPTMRRRVTASTFAILDKIDQPIGMGFYVKEAVAVTALHVLTDSHGSGRNRRGNPSLGSR